MRIVSKTPIGKKEVYDIGLRGPHNFMIEGGIFSSNCFNRSHSISYSFLTYITAYLKANHPIEFFCALMTTRSKSLQPKLWAQKAPQYVNEARQLGVHIHAPSVNASDLEFTIQKNEVYFGLNAIRDVGKTAARSIVKARNGQPFKDIFDFVGRVNTQKVNIKVFVALIRAGAFDKMGYSRQELEEKTLDIYNYFKSILEYEERLLEIRERDKYNTLILPKIEKRNELRKLVKKYKRQFEKSKPTVSEIYLLGLEKELIDLEEQKLKKKVSLKSKDALHKPEFKRTKTVSINFKEIVEQANYIGCYIDSHPVSLISSGSTEYIDSLNAGEYANIAAVITNIKIIITRKTKKKMAFLELDDSKIICEAVVFPNQFPKIENLDLEVGSLVICSVKVQQVNPVKLIINKVKKYEG